MADKWIVDVNVYVLALIFVSVVVGQNDSTYCPYAKYVSVGETHTACLPPNSSCEITSSGVDKEDQDFIVHAHNVIRSAVAMGEQTGAGGVTLPSAADMRQLNWNDDLAKVAQAHTNQCRLGFDCYNCRTVEEYNSGIMYYYIPYGNVEPATADWGAAIDSWASSSNVVSSVKAGKYGTTTFAQLIWALSKDIGCGFTSYRASGAEEFIQYYTCLYGPTGNRPRFNIYEEGPPCSDCSFQDTCCNSNTTTKSCPATDKSESFPGLCKISTP